MLVFATASIAFTGCEPPKPAEGYVFVDNGADELIEVFVDGERKARIGPGRLRKLTLEQGEYHFKVVAADQTIYDQTHEIDSGSNPYENPRYVLNPDNSHRYCEIKVVYFDEDEKSGQNLEDLISMISASGGEAEEEEADDGLTEAERRKRDRFVARVFREKTEDLVPMGSEAFFEVRGIGNLFKPMPRVVYSSQKGDQTRTTLARVPKVLHDYAIDAMQIAQPSKADLERLNVAHEVATSYVPFR